MTLFLQTYIYLSEKFKTISSLYFQITRVTSSVVPDCDPTISTHNQGVDHSYSQPSSFVHCITSSVTNTSVTETKQIEPTSEDTEYSIDSEAHSSNTQNQDTDDSGHSDSHSIPEVKNESIEMADTTFSPKKKPMVIEGYQVYSSEGMIKSEKFHENLIFRHPKTCCTAVILSFRTDMPGQIVQT